MKITKYAERTCVRCKVLDRVLKNVELPCEVETIYVEDMDSEALIAQGIESLPTLVIENEDKKEMLSGMMTPDIITEAIKKVG